MNNDSEIIRSWHINAIPWIKAIQNEEIESRNIYEPLHPKSGKPASIIFECIFCSSSLFFV